MGGDENCDLFNDHINHRSFRDYILEHQRKQPTLSNILGEGRKKDENLPRIFWYNGEHSLALQE
jgi:hypothetical protein